MNHSKRVVSTDVYDITEHLPTLRAALEEQRRFRLDQIVELEAESFPGTADGPRSQVAAAVKAAAVAALADIRAALSRLDDGTYGRCERCGSAIPLERLEILPMSRLCMPCQHTKETGRNIRSQAETAVIAPRTGPNPAHRPVRKAAT
jgi:DnaK suppressor protein